MGMANIEVKGTHAVYYVDGVEICRRSLSTMTSGHIDLPQEFVIAMGSSQFEVKIQYQTFNRIEEFMNRAERRGLRSPKKKSHGPQKHWYNRR